MKILKNIVIAMAILIGLPTISLADNLDLNVSVDVQNGQSQYDIGGSGDDTSEYISTFSGFPGIVRQLAPRALYDPKKESSVWRERRELRWDELYHNLKKIENLMEKSGDIFQSTSRPKTVGKNSDNVNILTKIPQGINDRELWSFQIQSPINGFHRETINRAVSIAKLVTGTRRVLVLQYGMLNPWNAGNAWGSNNAASWIDGGAFAVAPGVQMGKSQSLVYQRQMITVYCYNDSDNSPTPISTPVARNTSKNFSFLFGPNGIDPADPALTTQAKKLKSIITIQRKKIKKFDNTL